jgi:hypothetical protein
LDSHKSLKNRNIKGGSNVKKVLIASGICIALNASAASQRYCNGVAEMAATYVSDREHGQPYISTLSYINEAIEQANFSAVQADKFKRDLHIAARWVYIESPQLNREGAFKLIHGMCMNDDLH